MVRGWGNGFLGKEQRHGVRNGEEELSKLGQNQIMARHTRGDLGEAHMDGPSPHFLKVRGPGSGPGLEEWKIFGSVAKRVLVRLGPASVVLRLFLYGRH